MYVAHVEDPIKWKIPILDEFIVLQVFVLYVFLKIPVLVPERDVNFYFVFVPRISLVSKTSYKMSTRNEGVIDAFCRIYKERVHIPKCTNLGRTYILFEKEFHNFEVVNWIQL